MAQVDNYEWIFLIPTGWADIARKMIEECEAVYPDWEIIDLKEKYGRMRCYDDGAPSSLREEIDNIIDKYENMSGKICCICGKPATKLSTGWICPYCDDCGDKDEKFYKRFENED